MGSRPRHSKPALEQVLKSAEDQGWTVTKRKKYFMMWCPCRDKHYKTVKLSPSGSNYKKNLLAQLSRATCWKDESE